MYIKSLQKELNIMTKQTDITKKQKEIIALLFRFRFLDRSQIQRFLNHKDEARTNEWLKGLTDKEYLNRIWERNAPQNTKPAVYHLAKNGIRFMKEQNGGDQKAVQKFYRENERSSSFIFSCMLLADIYIDLKKRDGKEISFDVSVKSDYGNHPLEDLLKELSPTAYIEQNNKGETKRYFLEMLFHLPPERLRQRIKKYLSFYQWSDWETETGNEFPTVLIICPDDKVLLYAKRYIKRRLALLDEPELTIHLTTAGEARGFGITGDIWKAL